jgi:hypothetical protein
MVALCLLLVVCLFFVLSNVPISRTGCPMCCPSHTTSLFFLRTSGTGYGQAWEMAPRMWFYSLWLSYARSWQAVLHSWDDATTTTTTDMMIRPQTPFPVGILVFNIEAQSIVARVEKKLVGMSQMHGLGD